MPDRSGHDKFAQVLNIDADTRDLTQLDPSSRNLIILWSGDRPVAQLWTRPGEPRDAVCARLAGLTAAAPPPEPLRAPPASVSLVVCTRDRADELARCLASLPWQTRVPDEVIVVDNASRDDRARQAAEAAGVTYVREDRPGLDIARNAGFRAARGEIVAYTDDDTELHPRWLERLVAAFDRDDVMAVTGLVLPARLDTEAQWVFEDQWSFGRGFERIDFDQDFYRRTRPWGCPAWEIGAGANMAFRRTVMELVGPFDERLDVGAAGCSGDSEYWYRILAHGYVCRYEPSAVVLHHHRLAMDGLRSQIYHYMRGHVAALMVQFERTGDWGNLRRAFVSMPAYYARQALRALRPSGARPQLLGEQVRGAVSGLLYYLRSPKPAR